MVDQFPFSIWIVQTAKSTYFRSGSMLSCPRSSDKNASLLACKAATIVVKFRLKIWLTFHPNVQTKGNGLRQQQRIWHSRLTPSRIACPGCAALGLPTSRREVYRRRLLSDGELQAVMLVLGRHYLLYPYELTLISSAIF